MKYFEGITKVGQEIRSIDVGSCDGPGCYSNMNINYGDSITIKQLAALAEVSSACEQSIKV